MLKDDMFPVLIEHKSGHTVQIETEKNRVVILSPDGTSVVLDKVYRWCTKCDGVRPISQFSWRSMGDAGELRTQPNCERHSRT